MSFDVAFVHWEKVLLDILKLSNLLSFDPVPLKTEIICIWFETMKNDWVWRKVFERLITILNVSVDIIGAFFTASTNIREASTEV